MTNRTVKVLGWGVGQAVITAVLDGQTVFSGTVDLVEMTKDNEGEQTSPTLFSFEIPMEFAGTKHMIITVKDSAVRFGQIVANYTETSAGFIFSSGPDEYVDIVDFDSDYVRDPRSNVTIDNIKQEQDRSLGKGTWQYVVNPGSIFEHDLTVSMPGLVDD